MIDDPWMTRVAVIGNAGGGKSTLCRRMGERLGLPVYTIDQVQWLPGWVHAGEAAVAEHQARWLAGGRWIIDGFGGERLIAERFAAADTVIFVDLPLYVHYWWAAKRQVRSLVRPAPDMAPGCPMWTETWPLFKLMWWLNREWRPKMINQLFQLRRHKRVIHLRSPQAMRDFLASLPAVAG